MRFRVRTQILSKSAQPCLKKEVNIIPYQVSDPKRSAWRVTSTKGKHGDLNILRMTSQSNNDTARSLTTCLGGESARDLLPCDSGYCHKWEENSIVVYIKWLLRISKSYYNIKSVYTSLSYLQARNAYTVANNNLQKR